MKFRATLLILCAIFLGAPLADAQFLGTVQLQTVQATLANNVTCTGNSQTFLTSSQIPNFRNLGQIQHQVSAGSTAASFAVEIDGIDNLGTVFRISNPQIVFVNGAITSYVVQGSGYYPNIQVGVTCTAGATFSMSYSGSSAAPTTIIGAPGGNPLATGGVVGNVQGIIAQGNNGATVFPIVNGALSPAINAQFLSQGVDSFSTVGTFYATGQASGVISLPPPLSAAAGEWGLAFATQMNVGTVNTLNGPWACIGGGGCNAGGQPNALSLALNPNSTNTLSYSITNSLADTIATAAFVFFAKIPTIRQNGTTSTSTTFSTGVNTLAGSTLIAAVSCAAFPCQINGLTDSQGNTWKLLRSIQVAPTGTFLGGGISVFATGPSSAAAETVTIVPAPGTTASGASLLEFTGVTTASPTTPLVPLGISNKGFAASENDNGGLFVNAGGFSLSQTFSLSTATTLIVPLWDQTQHGIFNSCVVTERITSIAGAGTTLNTYLQDSADKVGFNDRLSMTQGTTAAGAQNLFGTIPAFTATALTATANSAVVSTDAALAAGSGIAGPLGPFGRIKFVTTGAAVAVTVTYNVVCR